jgi:hypothetical protein
MTCYLRFHEIVVGVQRTGAGEIDWDESLRRWQAATGAEGRDAALEAMPVTAVDVDALPATDLEPFAGLIVSSRTDQRLLDGMADRLAGFLDAGRVLVFSGQLAGGWIPGAAPFERHEPVPEGPPQLASEALFDGVDPKDVTGLLYRDGWHRPPDGAEIVARRADGSPGTYVDRTSTAGTILLHGGLDFLSFATDRSSAATMIPRLVAWVRAEADDVERP